MSSDPQVTSEGTDLREATRAKFWNRLDPVFWLLDRVIFAPFFNPRLPGVAGPATTIEVPEVSFLIENTRKHRAIVWANILALATIIASGLPSIGRDALQIVTLGLVAPVVVSGIAWYSISFSGVPERFGRHAMLVTGVLFLAVSFSLTTLFVVLAAVTPIVVSATVLTPIYLALYLAGVFYDNLDGLRAAASQRAVIFSRAQAYYPHAQSYQQEPVLTSHFSATQAAAEDDVNQRNSDTFAELTVRLDHLLDKLAERQQPMIANVLISDALNELVRLLNLTLHPLALDQPFHDLVAHAHKMSVVEVNELAARYLHTIVQRVHALVGDSMADEAGSMVERLGEIRRLRSEPEGGASRAQEVADFLFVEVLRQLVSVIRANRARLVASKND